MLLDDRLKSLLQHTRSIAIVGAKDKPGQPVDRVGRYLLAQGYSIFPVHPVRATVWGLTAWPSLAQLPQPVDMVNLFRASEHCPAHAREILELAWKPRCFWMQEGIRCAEAGELMARAGVIVVEDLCIKTEHYRLGLVPVKEEHE